MESHFSTKIIIVDHCEFICTNKLALVFVGIGNTSLPKKIWFFNFMVRKKVYDKLRVVWFFEDWLSDLREVIRVYTSARNKKKSILRFGMKKIDLLSLFH